MILIYKSVFLPTIPQVYGFWALCMLYWHQRQLRRGYAMAKGKMKMLHLMRIFTEETDD